jgi:NADPH-dependent 2,4-dienoyl-CoA reductase/sulfur reductase-like enzyme
MKRHTVFLGGGLASATAICSYREAGGDDRLTLVTSEVVLPYHRPPLSKGYMRGESERDDALVEPANRYVDADVELRVGTVVDGVDLGARTLGLGDAGERLGSPELSNALRELFSARGIEVLLEHEVTAIEGNDRVEHVIAGDRRLEAGLVVVGVGVEPATGMLAEAGLELDDGIVVDECFSTSTPNVFAVGDVARFPDAVAGRARRIEHWDNAKAQGEHLGRLLAGATQEPFSHVAMFFSDVFDLSFELYGDLHEHDDVIVRGNLEEHHALALFLRHDVLTAGLAIGQDEETTAELSDLIAQRARVESSQRSALGSTDATLSEALATEASQ